jgi:CRP/FNR family transcriptional regulator
MALKFLDRRQEKKNDMALRELLTQIDLFQGLSSANAAELSAVSLRRKILKNQILFVEGQKGRSIFILETGVVQLYKSSPAGREVLIRAVKPGEIFAEILLFERDTYPVTARVAQSGTLYAIPKLSIHYLLDQRDFRNAFIGGILKRYRHLTDRILYLSAYDSEQRFKLYLKDLYGEKSGTFHALPKKSAAEAISISPETLSRLLLKYKKHIRWAKGKIEIARGFH